MLAELQSAAQGFDRPSVAVLQRRIADLCAAQGLKPPSRASLYKALSTIEGHAYDVSQLPSHVAGTLYNLAPEAGVPGRQLAFYCFNYGSLAAVSFAAGLPWLDLYQASRLRGWRQRSRGLLQAVMRARGIR